MTLRSPRFVQVLPDHPPVHPPGRGGARERRPEP